MKAFNDLEIWFVTGSQHLYGPETLRQVAENSQQIAAGLNDSPKIPAKIIYKPTVKTPDEITEMCMEANASEKCVGLIFWMHTFSPAKMWIGGLSILNKPWMHLHTQFNQDLPWGTIDMDFMNLTQSAHGGREFGHIGARFRKERKVVVGHWQDEEVRDRIAAWTRAAVGWYDCSKMKIARFSDNMREVAVTEGDKVAAQMKFGYSVNGYGVGDLVKYIDGVTDQALNSLVNEYYETYQLGDMIRGNAENEARVIEAARIEAGMRSFLEEGGFTAFTNYFGDLHGMAQLPGIATQRLMESGYGYGGEGDWKTAGLVRTMKFMGTGLGKGTSFMEDYTYHLNPQGPKVLGSHMLEVCPSIASGTPRLEVHQLGIGGKDDPARLVFNSPSGEAINATIVDMGSRFRMILNEVTAVQADEDLPKLPVARAVWEPKPNLKDAAATWILAGGTHHTSYSLDLNSEHMQDFAEIADIELLQIDAKTDVRGFKNELRWNDLYYHLAKGI